MKPVTRTGLERLCQNPIKLSKNCRIGLLANPASVDSRFNHAAHLINRLYPGQLKALFSPQHGFYAEKQDNMIESDHGVDEEFGIPVFSLYSATRKPERNMMDLIDLMFIDIQDVGTRVYTFIYTISYCLEVAALCGKKVIILDRPNPLGGVKVEGNLLEQECSSFVGRYEIPMRHGLTVGEFAQFINKTQNIGANLEVIPMENWSRDMVFESTGLPWIAPSPNLPTPAAATVYPGQVIFEGTNISEGRGTTQPFELFGAPFISSKKILERVEEKVLGAKLRPVCFQPCSGKWQNQVCQGFQIHVTAETYRPYQTSLLLLQAIIRLWPDEFQWKLPPYEYEFKRRPIDLILGSRTLAERIENMEDLETIAEEWTKEEAEFKGISKPFWLYA